MLIGCSRTVSQRPPGTCRAEMRGSEEVASHTDQIRVRHSRALDCRRRPRWRAGGGPTVAAGWPRARSGRRPPARFSSVAVGAYPHTASASCSARPSNAVTSPPPPAAGGSTGGVPVESDGAGVRQQHQRQLGRPFASDAANRRSTVPRHLQASNPKIDAGCSLDDAAYAFSAPERAARQGEQGLASPTEHSRSDAD
jgi:hypothetical protein